MVSKRRPARTIYKPSGEANGLNRQAAQDDAVDGLWQEQTTLTRDKSKNPRDSGRAKNATPGASAASRGVRTLGGAAAPNKSLNTGAANHRKKSAVGKSAAMTSRATKKGKSAQTKRKTR
jgi:hypothetical protein